MGSLAGGLRATVVTALLAVAVVGFAFAFVGAGLARSAAASSCCLRTGIAARCSLNCRLFIPRCSACALHKLRHKQGEQTIAGTVRSTATRPGQPTSRRNTTSTPSSRRGMGRILSISDRRICRMIVDIGSGGRSFLFNRLLEPQFLQAYVARLLSANLAAI